MPRPLALSAAALLFGLSVCDRPKGGATPATQLAPPPPPAAVGTLERPGSAARGHALVLARCAGCHATESTGASPAPDAPPFRTLAARYDVGHLEEAFVEGIMVGDSPMPHFELTPEESADLVAWLREVGATSRGAGAAAP